MAQTQFNRLQKQSVRVALYDRDNHLDETSDLLVTSQQPSCCTAVVDPNDNRVVVMISVNPGVATISIGSQQTPNPLQIQVQVTDTPNLAHIDLVSIDPPVEK